MTTLSCIFVMKKRRLLSNSSVPSVSTNALNGKKMYILTIFYSFSVLYRLPGSQYNTPGRRYRMPRKEKKMMRRWIVEEHMYLFGRQPRKSRSVFLALMYVSPKGSFIIKTETGVCPFQTRLLTDAQILKVVFSWVRFSVYPQGVLPGIHRTRQLCDFCPL